MGGARQERNAFTSLLRQVDTLLFITSLSDYNQACFEDISTPRLKEGLPSWKKVVTHDSFNDICVSLIFNKKDLFQIKYFDKKIPIRVKLSVPAEVGRPSKWIEEDNRECGKAIEWFKHLYMAEVPLEKQDQIKILITSAVGKNGVNQLKV